MIEPKTFAASTLQLLQQDPRRYRNFGSHWWFVKLLLKQFYDQHNLSMLGDYIAPDAQERMPPYTELQAALTGAVEEYQHNASFNLGRIQVQDRDGELYTLMDPDAGI